MVEAIVSAGEVPAEAPARASRVWRIVLIVLMFQVLAIVVAIVLFSTLGLANDVGSCGGG